ncbi:MAG: flagellar FlbD family protein [Planctomycetes bacterium]|nr:flagellar FlbD family protein [Planctomycetota bacterium]MCH8968666.1 flagellar FlbD family protein [Planctomycetota bacterium]
MITVTRLNDQPLVLNAELIKTVESTPDTLITLINGDRMMVKESMEEIVRKAVEYGRQIRAFAVQ